MELANIFAEAIRKGSSSSQEEVKRDLAFLLTLPTVGDVESLSSQVEGLLVGDTTGLAWLNEIKALSQTTPPPTFGPVRDTEAGAAERLALGVKLRSSLQTKSDAKSFVEESSGDLLSIFGIAKQIWDYLSDAISDTNPSKRLWIVEFTPAFLEKILKNQPVLRILTIAATGGDLPTEWEDVESWVNSWVIPTRRSPRTNPGGDGFFEPQHTNYQPAAVHPLVLRILRRNFLDQLIAGETQEDVQAFCRWLVSRIFDGELLDGTKLESIFAAGSLILTLAQQQGVIIHEDGQLTIPTTAPFWGDLSERVLKTIVNNSQQIDGVPSFWKNTQDKIRQLLYSCPEWHSAPLVINLRSRADKLLEDELEVLKTVIIQESLKLTEDKFKPEVELSSQSALTELRPEKPISINEDNVPERKDYFKKLDRLNSQISDISSFNSVIQDIATNAVQRRIAFEQRLASPLAEPALPALTALSYEEPDRFNLVLATYLRQQVSQFSLDSNIIRSGNLTQETLANQPAWLDIINQTATTDEQVLSSWSKLDTWDGLRGRLARSTDNEGDRNVTLYLRQQLPDWLRNETTAPPTDIDLNAIRPILAELAHLGVSLQDDDGTYEALTKRLETLISLDDLDDALKTLLAAMRLELGLTALSIGVVPRQAFKQFESPSRALFEQFANWIQRSIESSNVWESRAGMNALILLARLAEGTGDLFINSAINTAMPAGSRASGLVAQSVNQLFSISSKGAGLPLAFAAFDLARYAREVTLSIAPQVTDGFAPVWAQQPISEFVDRLVNQLGTATNTTLQTMIAEGGIGLKVLLLSLFQLKLDELDWERQLIVQPLHRNASPQEAKLRHNIILQQIDNLQKAVRFVFCREQLLLIDTNELPEVSGEIKPWWQVSYWLALSSNSQDGQLNSVGSVSPALGLALEEGRVPPEIQTLLGLSGQAIVRSILRRQR